MNKELLLKLHKNGGLRPGDVREADPELADELEARLGKRVRRKVIKRVPGASAALREAIEVFDLPLDRLTATPLRELALDALRDAATASGSEDLVDEAERLTRELGNAREEDLDPDPAGLRIPISLHPEFAADYNAGNIYRLTDAAGLDDEVAETLISRTGKPAELTNVRLGDLVTDGKLDEETAAKVGNTLSLSNALDGRADLVEAVLGSGTTTTKELVGRDAEAWTAFLTENKVQPPRQLTTEDYAGVIADRIGKLHPSATIADRVRVTPEAVRNVEAGLQPLLEINRDVPVVSTGHLAVLETGGLDEPQLDAAAAALAEAVALDNRLVGMGIAEVLDDVTRQPAERVAEVARRAKLVEKLFATNDDLLDLNLTSGSGDVDRVAFPAEARDKDKPRMLATARAYQRTMAVAKDPVLAESFVAAGYPSAVSIAAEPLTSLVEKLGVSETLLAKHKDAATSIAKGVAGHAGTIIDVLNGTLKGAVKVQEKATGWLKELPGFEDFFGSQNFCDCKHCQSILGPAAYFVDLMCFIESNVTSQAFAHMPNHRLALQSRRPDLWNLDLTCPNTSTPIPYLVIINEVLENAMAAETGFGGDDADRAAVEDWVYRQQLPGAVNSFGQPLNLAFQQTRVYLQHFDVTLADVAEAGRTSGDDLARLRLDLPPEDFELIHTPAPGIADLRRVYDLPELAESNNQIKKFDAQLLLPAMDVDRGELTELLATRFVTANGAEKPHIVGSKSSAESVQNDIEHAVGLTRDSMDRMHRFVRLWRATGWRIGELDLVLTHLRDANLGTNLNRAAVQGVATVHRLCVQLDESVEATVALWSTIPRHPVVPSVTDPGDPEAGTVLPTSPGPLTRLATPLFDRLFNATSLVAGANPYPQPGTQFIHPVLSSANGDPDPNLARLTAALGVSEGGLLDLLLGLAGTLGIDLNSADDADKRITLDLATLSALYRHALLSRMLDVDILELFALAAMAPDVPGHVDGLEDLSRLAAFAEWVEESPWSIADLIAVLRPATPAVLVAENGFGNVGAGEALRVIVRVDGEERADDSVSPAATNDLDDLVADLNAQLTAATAYRADADGRPRTTGNRLALRSRSTGAAVDLELAEDSAALLRAGVPETVSGTDLALGLSEEGDDALVAAESLVAEVAESGALVFSDSVLATTAPTAPTAVSAAAVAGSNGETVTVVPTVAGHAEAEETIALGNNTDIDTVVTDWNAQSNLVRAYRADGTGAADDSGDRIAITLDGALGSSSQLTVTADDASVFTPATPQSYTGKEVTEAQSQAVLAANPDRWETAAGEGNLRLVAGVDLTTPLVLPPTDPATSVVQVDESLEPALRERLGIHHSAGLLTTMLPSRLDVDPERLAGLLHLTNVDLSSDALFSELRGNVEPTELATVIDTLRPISVVFRDMTFSVELITGIGEAAALLGVPSFRDLNAASLRHIATVWTTLQPWRREPDAAPDVLGIVSRHTNAGFADADADELARLLKSDTATLDALEASLPATNDPFHALGQLAEAARFCAEAGLGGAVLRLARGTDHATVSAASAALLGAMRAGMTEEEEWETRLEPYTDELLSLRRDGLVAHLIHSGHPEFDEALDLYRYYLLDVELEGCARTSRVASAIDSAQLYVHRIRMNLEETGPGDQDPIHVEPALIDPDEWQWRQHYRVWEANRKIFLYPENFIEPELRDNKTPLFDELEQELLSKDLNEETIVEAYARYLRGFDEVAHLTIAGAYNEKDEDSGHDVLHLFGVTADEPPTYYYRRVEDSQTSVEDPTRATKWRAWERVDAQIPVRKVSPIVHRGQLFVFWNRYTTKPINAVTDGTNEFVGYDHRGYVEFSKQRLDGSWTPPQGLKLGQAPFEETTYPTWYHSDGTIQDRIVTKTVEPIAFDALVTFFNMTISIRLNADGYGTVRFPLPLLPSFTIQLPADVMASTGQSSITIGDIEVRVTPVLGSGLRAPMYASVEHSEALEGYSLAGVGWERPYPATGAALTLRGFDFQMASPVDLYRLQIGNRIDGGTDPETAGVPWSDPVAFVFGLILSASDCGISSDGLSTGRLIWSEAVLDRRKLHSAPSTFPCFEPYAFASVLLHQETVPQYGGSLGVGFGPRWSEEVTDYLRGSQRLGEIGTVPTEALLQVVNGSIGDVIIQTSRDALYLQSDVRDDGRYQLRRLNTSLSEDINDLLFNQGLDVLLATETQLGLGEHYAGAAMDAADVADATDTGDVDYDGPMGTYLREIFFHIPFLIADHFNSQGRFEEAQRWYHYIFDPTSTEVVPAPDELDRSWRYREFRGLTLESLRAQLGNQPAIEAYRDDPFNPHAVARMRMTAYQKAIVMKYVDNLLDWGDDRFIKAFSQLNPELLREATLRYATAQEILGKRPAQLGDCGEGSLNPKSFAQMEDLCANDATFLMELESVVLVRKPRKPAIRVADTYLNIESARAYKATGDYVINRAAAVREREAAAAAEAEVVAIEPAEVTSFGADNAVANRLAAANADNGAPVRHRLAVTVETQRGGRVEALGGAVALDALRGESWIADAVTHGASGRPTLDADIVGDRLGDIRVEDTIFGKFRPRPSSPWTVGGDKVWNGVLRPGGRFKPDFEISILRQISPAFCVPGNHRMLGLWDRVEDRLFKLRNCQDVDGVPRQLPLFAPPIDPAMLVGGRAAGLSLDDILSAAAGTMPPYRFRYLLDKAKAYAATVQSFGGALLSALEKRDAEALTRLRNTHQKNLLTLARENKRAELKAAEEGLEGVRRRQAATQYRHDYFDGLASEGLTGLENFQTGARITSMGVMTTYAILSSVAGTTHLVPQVGSPFSMKYGGAEAGSSASAWGVAAGVTAGILDQAAEISGIFAGFERREQGWKHQKKLAANDLKTIEKDLAIAEIKVEMARRSLDIHDTTIEQHDEVMDYFEDKFTGLGLYTHLSRSLQQLHREAYGNALALARQAEKAYRFERPADPRFVVGGEWDGARSGLLAGERLSLALQGLERRYIETESRQAEINQSFSLTQIDPEALVQLKEGGTCEFAIPEFFFDMYYAGQYRRRIKSVRLTIPCVTGPYTNVSARLTLLESYVRQDPVLGEANRLAVPLSGTTRVATSTAQGDAGVFELNFRSERFMPFEGMGADSRWRLELPSAFHPFDYRTINDAIVNISYTAEDDGALRAEVEADNAAVEGSLLAYLDNNSLTRVFSLRQEFSTAFTRLVAAPPDTEVTLDVNGRHFPLMLQGKILDIDSADVVLVPKDPRTAIGSAELTLNGQKVDGFPDAAVPPDDTHYAGLPSVDAGAALTGHPVRQHTIAIADGGGLAAPAGSPAALADDALTDILLVIRYTLA